MTTASGKQISAGLARAVIFELDTNGYPAATGTSPYEGFDVAGALTLNLALGDPVRVVHKSNDRPVATQLFAPNDSPTGTLTVDGSDTGLVAAMQGVDEYAVGEMQFVSWVTDQQGNEPSVAGLFVQSSLDTSSKLGRHKLYVLPSMRIKSNPSSMDENAAQNVYNLAVNASSAHLWGTAYATGTEGAGEAGIDEGMSTYRPNIVAFKANGATQAFLLPTDKPAADVAKAVVWDNGVKQTSGVTVTTPAVTFDTAPLDTHIIVVLYEY
jgi:hypothetical protein